MDLSKLTDEQLAQLKALMELALVYPHGRT